MKIYTLKTKIKDHHKTAGSSWESIQSHLAIPKSHCCCDREDSQIAWVVIWKFYLPCILRQCLCQWNYNCSVLDVIAPICSTGFIDLIWICHGFVSEECFFPINGFYPDSRAQTGERGEKKICFQCHILEENVVC